YVELETTTTYNYQSLHQQGVELTPGVTSFKFKVRASNDAHVALLQEDGVTNRNIYEIVIGGWRNTQSVIRTGMQHANRVTARHRPLSATQFRDFWISWDSGVISVGTGTAVGAGRFMSWRDPSPHPSGTSLYLLDGGQWVCGGLSPTFHQLVWKRVTTTTTIPSRISVFTSTDKPPSPSG
ncbi:C3 and PZP-like alpha-2-macroglobulin domain-containing protein 8, partial [Haliotis rubra]|uniref:C3 and PZP-like alpha-2-macroglobulin domain-containing protein 8 n=1 Tax=Haliotis rubra TaxID=36100 RepID=UPI001EE50DC3